jgi:O-antigen ligase
LLFVFTLPFEAVDLEFIPGASSLARKSGIFLFGCSLLYPKMTFRLPPHPLWWFAGYVAMFILLGAFIPSIFQSAFSTRLNTLLQLLVVFWISFNLLRQEKLAREALLVFSIASALAAFAMMLGLSGFSVSWKVHQGERMTLSGFNPNDFSFILALAAVTTIGLGLSKTAHRSLWNKVFFLALTLPLLVALVYTGSRGPIVAFLVGVALYPLPYRKSRSKATALIWVAIGIAGLVYLVANDPTALSRWTRTYNKGDTAGRDRIFAASVEMVVEKPFVGWQPVVFWYELGSRVGWKKRDAHNLILHLLLEVGALGSIPFFVGVWLCAKGAWKARTKNLGLLPLALLIAVLVGNMSNTWLTRKPMWFIFSLAAASMLMTDRKQIVRGIVGPRPSPQPHARKLNYS